jgi:hypothetical protein
VGEAFARTENSAEPLVSDGLNRNAVRRLRGSLGCPPKRQHRLYRSVDSLTFQLKSKGVDAAQELKVPARTQVYPQETNNSTQVLL